MISNGKYIKKREVCLLLQPFFKDNTNFIKSNVWYKLRNGQTERLPIPFCWR